MDRTTPPGCVAAEAKTGPPRPPSRREAGRPAQAPCVGIMILFRCGGNATRPRPGRPTAVDIAVMVGALPPPPAGGPGRACGAPFGSLEQSGQATQRMGSKFFSCEIRRIRRRHTVQLRFHILTRKLWHYDYKSRKQYRLYVSTAARLHDPRCERCGSRRLHEGGGGVGDGTETWRTRDAGAGGPPARIRAASRPRHGAARVHDSGAPCRCRVWAGRLCAAGRGVGPTTGHRTWWWTSI